METGYFAKPLFHQEFGGEIRGNQAESVELGWSGSIISTISIELRSRTPCFATVGC
jgi:hypothetical protein